MWPQEYIELKHIEGLLVCGICYEIMDTSVITSCSHSYCSLCIRKYLHYKTQCPACFAETYEKDLRKNKVVDDIIAQFLQVKDKLKRCLQIQIQFAHVNNDENVSVTPKSSHRSQDSHVNKEQTKVANNNVSVSGNDASPFASAQNDMSSPSTSGRQKIPLMFTPKSSKRPIVTNTEDTKVVICPVCKVAVSELHINRHLDDCLKRESQKDRPEVSGLKRNPLPKLVFSLMKDLVLRKKLKEFGLSSQGERKALEARLQRYIILYNAECDKSYPRPISELIKQCEEEENVERKISKTSLLNKLQVTRNTEQNVIEDERKKYLQANKDSFAVLIKKIKGVDATKKPSARRSLLNESTESNENIPRKRQATLNLDGSMIEQNDLQPLCSGVYIEDSDSDTSCPLQIYSSTGSKKILNGQLSPSDNSNLQNKSECETSYEGHVDREKFKSNCTPLKVNKIENDDNSDASNDSFYQCIPKNDSQNSCHTPKRRMLLQKEEKLLSEDKIKRRESVASSITDIDLNNVRDQDEEVEARSSSFQDILRHFSSSNDSTENIFNYGRLRPVNHGALSSSELNSSNLEKENISYSPEVGGSHSHRKRGRDSVQTDNKRITPSKKKKVKKSSQYFSTEAKELNKEESSSTLYDRDVECLQNKPRMRKRLMSIAEDTIALRKSARTKHKSNNH